MCGAWYEDGLLSLLDRVFGYNRHLIQEAHLGGAVGWDTAVALICLAYSVPYTLHLTERHRDIIAAEHRPLFDACVQGAADVVVYGKAPDRYALALRNYGIVDNSDLLIAMWDNKRKGGTNHCINYAQEQNKLVFNLYFELRKSRPSYGERTARKPFRPRPGL